MWIIGSILLVAVLGFGYLLFSGRITLQCSDSSLKYLNPQIRCVERVVVNKKNYVAFKSKLIDYIQEQEKMGAAFVVSLYFRDLQYGPTFGIDEYKEYAPASLLKLPLMLAYLNLWEERDDILDIQVYFEISEQELVQAITPKVSARPGIHYTIEELIELLIKYSDNNSYYVLFNYLKQLSPDKDLLYQTYVDLGIIDPESNLDDAISVKSYAGIFTQLFNSSYFSRKETSERALDLLVDTDFTEGLVAGIPPGIHVAHKFGERYDGDIGLRQLHDCGIIYYPQNPYLLCVMTKGDNIAELKKVIADISRMVYEEFNSRRL